MGDPKRAAAMAALPALCAQAGLPQDGWEAHTLKAWEDVGRVSVLKLTHPGSDPLILKSEPRLGNNFIRFMEEHRAAHAAFPHSDDLTIPALLSYDAASCTSLMEFVQGQTLQRVVEAQPLNRQMEPLAQAGRWLAAFHASRPGKPRGFRPQYGLDAMTATVAKLDAGELDIPEPELFRRSVRRLHSKARAWKGKPTIAAAQHGDLSLRNILLAENQTAGIDFSGGHDAPVGHDIAQLLVEYASRYAPPEDVDTYEVVPQPALAAFFSGYDLTTAQDPSVQMMLHMRILLDWRRYTTDTTGLSPQQARRLVGLIHLARRAFDL